MLGSLLLVVLCTAIAVPALAYDPATLYNGSTGEEVRALQQALIDLGYLEGSADGIFGNKTENAVRRFQSKNGMTSDGLAGKRTRAALEAARSGKKAPAAETAAASAPAGVSAAVPVPRPAGVTDPSTLYNGCTGDAVLAMQQKLIDLGYLDGTADGKFGDSTEKAVRKFQSENGLKADGLAGKKTCSKLEKVWNKNNDSEFITVAESDELYKTTGIDWSTLEKKARQILKSEGYSTDGMNFILHDYTPKDVANGFEDELYWVAFYKSKESRVDDARYSVMFDYKWDMIKFDIYDKEKTRLIGVPTEKDIDRNLLDKALKEARTFLERQGKTELLGKAGSLELECINIAEDKIYYNVGVENTFSVRVQVAPSVRVDWFHTVE
jgi:peptidoglycan hydrolase-like protein with peptidoglycan-binding domain